MKTAMMIRAAFAVLVLAAGLVPVANAGTLGRPDSTQRHGPYDNTGNSPQQTFGMEGGGG
jgi:hypothetical protein